MREVNKTLLTQEQAALYEEWKKFFEGAGWKLFLDRFGPMVPYLRTRYDAARGEQELGYIQGSLNAANTLLNAELLVEADFLSLTGELVAAIDPESPNGPSDWTA